MGLQDQSNVIKRKEIIMNKKVVDRPFSRLSKEDFFARVDEGLSELDAGMGEDSDLVNAEIAAEFGLAL